MPIEFIGCPPGGYFYSFFDIRKYFTYERRPTFTDSMSFY